MFIFLVFFLAAVSTAALSIFTPLITDVYRFWWVIIFFIGSFVAAMLLILLLLMFTAIFIKWNPEKPNEKYSKHMRFIMEEFISFVLFLFGVRVKVTGEELIPKDRRFLMVGNHRSDLDPLIAIAVFKGMDISWIAKEVLFKIPLARKYMYRCNFLAMDRDDVRQSLRVINQAAEYVKSGVVSIGIYPEGTRNKTAEPLLPFKPGALKVAQKAGAPIVVTTMTNTDKIFKKFPLSITTVRLDIIKVYSAEEVAARKTNDLSEEISALMKEHLAEVKKK